MTIDRPQTGCYVNPYTSFGFKLLFGTEVNKELLIGFLNALLSLDSPIQDLQYKSIEDFGGRKYYRQIPFDALCTCEDGRQIIVELLPYIYDFLTDRNDLYTAFPIRDLAISGGTWGPSVYAVYMVGILEHTFSKDAKTGYTHETKLSNTTSKQVEFENAKYIYVELPKFKKPLEECNTLLDEWLFTLKHLVRLAECPAKLHQTIFKKLFKAAEVENLSERQLAQYEESLKVYRDWTNIVATKEKASREEGRKEGREEGREEGKLEEKQNIARNLKKLGLPTEQIKSATGLTEEEINKV